jgi:hypothetical protein
MRPSRSTIPGPATGYPNWITPELIARTLQVWRERWPSPMTEADAIDILVTVGRLAEVITSPSTESPPPEHNG